MVKIGIVGSGFGLYGLLPAFHSTKNCKVVSICGSKTERLVNYCKSIGLKNIYTDWQEMLNNEKLDAVAIAVIPRAQYQIARCAIGKNLHIFAEKPLTTSYKQSQNLYKLAKKEELKHMVDFLFPEISQWKKVKEIIDKKTFGQLNQICLNWDFLSYDLKTKRNTWRTNVSEGGGALSLYFSHSLYYLEYFAGKIKNIKSQLSYSKDSLNGAEVGVDLLLEFDKITGAAHLNCNAKGINRHQLIFYCELATIILENQGSYTSNFSIKIYTQDKIKTVSPPKEKKGHQAEDERVKTVRKMAKKFIQSISQNKKIPPTFEDGLRVQMLIEKIRHG